jgi:hypothetical protein
MKVINLIVFVLLSSLVLPCCTAPSGNNEWDCDGVFNARLTGDVEQQLCISEYENYQLSNHLLQFNVKNYDIAGRSLFELKLENYSGPGAYDFGLDQLSKFSLNVYGASDEFYRCVSGKIVVSEASTNSLQADFEVVLEGFYNKKTIHARGGIHL